MSIKASLVWAALALSPNALAIEKKNSCSSYTLINTRGTNEQQKESSGFRSVNSRVRGQLTGGKTYNTVYPAAVDQNSTSGTDDIIREVNELIAKNPSECIILEGYSQGASATCDALPRLTGKAFDAVKGVLVIGNPRHKAGLVCNVDMKGGDSTRNVNGVFLKRGPIPDNWVSKTLDVCNNADGVCDVEHGFGIPNGPHLAYPVDAGYIKLGSDFVINQLNKA